MRSTRNVRKKTFCGSADKKIPKKVFRPNSSESLCRVWHSVGKDGGVWIPFSYWIILRVRNFVSFFSRFSTNVRSSKLRFESEVRQCSWQGCAGTSFLFSIFVFENSNTRIVRLIYRHDQPIWVRDSTHVSTRLVVTLCCVIIYKILTEPTAEN